MFERPAPGKYPRLLVAYIFLNKNLHTNPKPTKKMDIAEPELDVGELKRREEHALNLIVGGEKKRKAVEEAKLPYQVGSRKYKNFTKRAGKKQLLQRSHSSPTH